MSQQFFLKQNPDEHKNTVKAVVNMEKKKILNTVFNLEVMMTENRRDADSFFFRVNELKRKLNVFLRELNIIGCYVADFDQHKTGLSHKVFTLMQKYDDIMADKRSLEYEAKKIAVDVACFSGIISFDPKQKTILEKVPQDFLTQLLSFDSVFAKYEKDFLLPLQDAVYRMAEKEAKTNLEVALKQYQQQIVTVYNNVFDVATAVIDQLIASGFFVTVKK